MTFAERSAQKRSERLKLKSNPKKNHKIKNSGHAITEYEKASCGIVSMTSIEMASDLGGYRYAGIKM